MAEPSPAPPPLNPPPGNSGTPYDFFLAENSGKGKKALLPGGGSKKARLAIIAAGGIVLLVVIIMVISFLGGGDEAKKAQLASLARQQNELVRLAGVGAKSGRNLEARNLAITTKLSLSTEQKNLQAALKTQGVRVNSSTLDKTKRTRHDSQLTIAGQTNRFDEVFLELMRTELAAYQKNLKVARDQAATKAFKAAMDRQYRHASTLAGLNPE